jgi:hypothetical protein
MATGRSAPSGDEPSALGQAVLFGQQIVEVERQIQHLTDLLSDLRRGERDWLAGARGEQSVGTTPSPPVRPAPARRASPRTVPTQSAPAEVAGRSEQAALMTHEQLWNELIEIAGREPNVETAQAGSGRRLVVGDPAELDDDLVRDGAEILTSRWARRYGRRAAVNRARRAHGRCHGRRGCRMTKGCLFLFTAALW